MPRGIAPIPTTYAGVTFRSRLEARWAVFFDWLGVRWDYESEPFRLSDGSGYLPDFWLPNWRAWFEVKPEGMSSVGKVERFATLIYRACGHDVYVGLGWMPHPHELEEAPFDWCWRPTDRFYRRHLLDDGVLKLTPRVGYQHAFVGCEGGEADLIDAFSAARTARFDPASREIATAAAVRYEGRPASHLAVASRG